MKNKIALFKKYSSSNIRKTPFLMLTLCLLSIFPNGLMAQIQEGLPKPTDQIDLSDTSDLVIFIILPILVLILYLFWRKSIKKRKNKGDQ